MSGQKRKVFLFILLVATLAFLTGYLYFNKGNIKINALFSQGNISNNQPNGKAFEFPNNFSEYLAFDVCDSGILACSKDGVNAYNKKGELIWTYSGIYNSPIIKTSGPLIMITDIGSKNIVVLENGKVKWENSVQGAVINAGINENGYIWVVHEQMGYKDAVTFFSQQGEIFTRKCAEDYTVSADIAPNNSELLINNVDTSKVKTNTNLVFLNLKGDVFSTITQDDAIFPRTGYMKNGNIVAAGDSQILCFDRNRKEKWRYGLEKNQLYSIFFETGKYVIAAMSGESKGGFFEGTKSIIRIIGDNGKVASECPISGQAKSLDSNGEVISVNTGRDVYFINNRGKIQGKYSSEKDIKNVKVIDNSSAAVFTKDSIVLVSSSNMG